MLLVLSIYLYLLIGLLNVLESFWSLIFVLYANKFSQYAFGKTGDIETNGSQYKVDMSRHTIIYNYALKFFTLFYYL
jgi:hypothetical protein